MARKPKKKFAIRFELGLGGLLGLGVLVFCIFLWMFLLGIWAGQTILSPSSSDNKITALARMTADIWRKGKEPAFATIPGTDRAAGPISPEQGKMPSFFTLQIGSFRDPAQAAALVKEWRQRGYQVFSVAGTDEEKSHNRVVIGKFKNLAEANAQAAALENSENTRAYITLLPESAFDKRQ